MIGISEALFSLVPDAQWVLRNDNYQEIEWLDDRYPKPSWEEINQEIGRLQAEISSTEYKRLRAAEYPDFRDYLDGVVKGDQDQIQAYIDKCLEIKQKYPKPE